MKRTKIEHNNKRSSINIDTYERSPFMSNYQPKSTSAVYKALINRVYIQSNDKLLDILYECHDEYYVLWFHFPKDGWFPIEDYEPIIFIFKDDNLQYLIARRHWEYQTYDINNLNSPLEILFDGKFHAPYPRTSYEYNWFKGKIKNYQIFDNYKVKEISPSDIPHRFRTGKNHPSLVKRFFVPVKDPREKAREILSNI